MMPIGDYPRPQLPAQTPTVPIRLPPSKPETSTGLDAIIRQPRSLSAQIQQGTEYAATLAFACRSVYCQNFSNQYAYVVEAQRFLVPWEVGALLPGNASQTLTVRWVSPQGITQPASPAGYLYVMASELTYPLVPGLLVPASAQ